MRRRQVLLAGVTVGHPDFRPTLAQHRFGQRLRPARRVRVQHRLGGDEHPMPVTGAVDAGGGLVGRDHPGGLELFLDRSADRRHRACRAAEGACDRALGDLEPEHLIHYPRQPLEPGVMAVVQIEQKRADPGAEWRSGQHAVRRRGAEAVAAGGAAPAEQLDPRHHGCDRRNVDVIVAMAAALPLPRDVGRTVRTRRRQPLDRLVRHRAKRPCRTRTRRPWLAPLSALPLATIRFAVLRRRRVAVLRGLLRLRQQRLEFRDPCRQPLDQRRLLAQQRVLVSLAQAVSKWRSHSYVESDSRRSRRRKVPQNANPVSSYLRAASRNDAVNVT